MAVPLRAVDEVAAEPNEQGWVIRARKAVVAHDPYLAGHFPAATIYPGVFVIESVRQAVASGLGAACDIVSVRSARFLVPLTPGDILVLHATVTPFEDGTLVASAQALVGEHGVRAAKVDLLLRTSGDGHAAVA